jgi:formylmethanofuran dehydrogenase subunit E
MGLPPELEQAGIFHTHVGPYLAIGLRMGRAVTDRLGSKPFSYRITARTGRRPPYSCLVDGVQLATPCTTGNGCLDVADQRTMSIEATAKDGRSLAVALNPGVYRRIETECTEENQELFALEIWEMPEGDLLIVSEEG